MNTDIWKLLYEKKKTRGLTWTGRWKKVSVRHSKHNVVIVLLEGDREEHRGRGRWKQFNECQFFSVAEMQQGKPTKNKEPHTSSQSFSCFV